MQSSPVVQSPRVSASSGSVQPAVVFDLGGVIVRICHSWQEATQVAGYTSPFDSQQLVPLTDLTAFNSYQSDQVSLAVYLEELAAYLGLTAEEAMRVHLSILREPYPGIGELIDDLNNRGIRTGCLSNTNAPHWVEMTQTERFAPVGRLQMKLGSHEIGLAKPDLGAFRAYEVSFGLSGKEIVYFDDNEQNVTAARLLGWNAHVVDPFGDTSSQISKVLSQVFAPVA